MKEIIIKVYSYKELSEEIKKKVLNKYCDINVDFEWWKATFEDATNIGLKINSFDLDRNRNVKGEFTLSANEVAQNILNNHGPNCETYKTTESFMKEWQPVFDSYMDENNENYESSESEEQLNNLESNFLESILEYYSLMLQKECDYLQSEEAIIETIQSNEYTFTIEGKMMNS